MLHLDLVGAHTQRILAPIVRYRVVELLASGAFGVWRCRGLDGTNVAVKVRNARASLEDAAAGLSLRGVLT